MALAVTSLVGAVTQGATQMKLTAFTNPSAGGIGPDTIAIVDGETVKITNALLSPTVSVVRGVDGTKATAHNALAPVIYGLTTDFVQLAAQGAASIATAAVASYSVNGAITVPLVDQTILITKGSLCALTLAAPAADQTNTVTIVSLTAFAHTITYTAGFYGNTTSSDVLSMPATSGGVAVIRAQSGVWVPVATAASGATIA